MISFRDASTLARAKLRSKRIMLTITVVVSGLLFGVLYGAAIIVTGISESAQKYTRTALDGKYLVKSIPNIPLGVLGPDVSNGLSKEKIAELNAFQADYIARQKAQAKKLSIAFDDKSIAPLLIPDPFADPSLPAERKVRYNTDSPIFQEYLGKLQADYAKVATNKLSDLKAAATPYGASAFSQNQNATVNFTNMVYLPDGKEDPTKFGPNARPQNSDLSTYGYLISSVRNSFYSIVDESLIKRFVLPPNDKRQANTSAIPVVITTDEAMALFGKQYGIEAKPAAASGQLAWMKDLQSKVNGTTYTACYRNAGEVDKLTKIAQAATEAADHKNDPNYVTPALTYNLPTEPCGAITVKQDKRSAVEKKTEADSIALQKALGTYQAPQHQLLTFMVVGVMPVSPQDSALSSLPGFMNSLLGAQYGAGAMIPQQLYHALPASARHEDILIQGDGQSFSLGKELTAAGIGETIITFPTVKAARNFITHEGCTPLESSCKQPFILEAYGSNYLLLDDIDTLAAKGLRLALPLALVIAGVIIWATMARVIIDSRRETAVFRAIGAKRRDIMAIYLLYCAIVAMRIVMFSAALGLGAALVVQALYSSQVTDYAKVAYGVFDKGQTFSFIGLNPIHALLLAACITSLSIVAVLPPLIRNVRRNPINDMRDE